MDLENPHKKPIPSSKATLVKGALTENMVKRITLGFLKSHYRYRPRSGETELSSDMRGKGGIIADGFLSFPQEDGTKFTATFEATSYDTREEVRYTPQKEKLLWDGIAVSSLSTAFWYHWHYLKETGWIPSEIGFFIAICLGIALFGVILLSFQLIFSRFPRYRHIYAIEQFKQYHANEQWIAVAEDVFHDRENNKYYKELRSQCTYNGFGLILIDANHKPHLHLTPSREDTFKKKRKVLQFETLKEFTQRLQQGMNAEPRLSYLERIRKNYYHQFMLSVFAIFLISWVLYYEYQKKKIIYVDEKTYPSTIIEKTKGNSREPAYVLIDSNFLEPYDLTKAGYLQIQERLPSFDWNLNQETDIVINDGGGHFIDYDCERLYTFQSTKYIVLDAIFPDLLSARQYIDDLKSSNISASCLWLGCFSNEEGGYGVFHGMLYNDTNEAGRYLMGFRKRFPQLFKEKKLQIKPLKPVSN